MCGQLYHTSDTAAYWGDVYNQADMINYLTILSAACMRCMLIYDCGWPNEQLCTPGVAFGSGKLALSYDNRESLMRIAQFAYASIC